MKGKIISLLSVLLIISMMMSSACLAATLGNGQDVTSAGACIMDFESGDVLYEYNGNTPRVPASMTKVMNLYCIYEALASGEITLDTKVPISGNVHNKSFEQSSFRLYSDVHYTVDEMIDIIAVYSANSAAFAMAELVSGSEAAFVERMNHTAKRMGIDAYYYDSYGIALNQVSPIAMATLARNIIKDYPDILNRTSKKSVYFHGKTYETTNRLLDTYYYAGADGLKTGTTSAAGYCFCATAVRNGERVIAVTMSSSNTNQRFVDVAHLMDYGFQIIEELYSSIYFTDRITNINGAEVPTFVYKGEEIKQVIIAEDLRNYGFDVLWNGNEQKLYVTYNKNKGMTPMVVDYYKNKNGIKAYSILRDNKAKVILNDGLNEYQLEEIYNVNGYICISIDELSKIYDVSWVNNSRADISIAEK